MTRGMVGYDEGSAEPGLLPTLPTAAEAADADDVWGLLYPGFAASVARGKAAEIVAARDAQVAAALRAMVVRGVDLATFAKLADALDPVAGRVPPRLAHAPIDDEIEMPEEAAQVAEARAAVARGEVVSTEELLHGLGCCPPSQEADRDGSARHPPEPPGARHIGVLRAIVASLHPLAPAPSKGEVADAVGWAIEELGKGMGRRAPGDPGGPGDPGDPRVARLVALISEANDALFDAADDDPEHMIGCHAESLPTMYRRACRGVSKALELLQQVVRDGIV